MTFATPTGPGAGLSTGYAPARERPFAAIALPAGVLGVVWPLILIAVGQFLSADAQFGVLLGAPALGGPYSLIAGLVLLVRAWTEYSVGRKLLYGVVGLLALIVGGLAAAFIALILVNGIGY